MFYFGLMKQQPGFPLTAFNRPAPLPTSVVHELRRDSCSGHHVLDWVGKYSGFVAFGTRSLMLNTCFNDVYLGAGRRTSGVDLTVPSIHLSTRCISCLPL